MLWWKVIALPERRIFKKKENIGTKGNCINGAQQPGNDHRYTTDGWEIFNAGSSLVTNCPTKKKKEKQPLTHPGNLTCRDCTFQNYINGTHICQRRASGVTQLTSAEVRIDQLFIITLSSLPYKVELPVTQQPIKFLPSLYLFLTLSELLPVASWRWSPTDSVTWNHSDSSLLRSGGWNRALISSLLLFQRHNLSTRF